MAKKHDTHGYRDRMDHFESMIILGCCIACLSSCMHGHCKQNLEVLQHQVMDTERAFAKTMADRDSAAFASFVSDEAVFFSGPVPLRGKKRVIDWWKRHYEKQDAPFSWALEQVEVLDSGTLALSTGPVYDPKGRKVATFTSIWRMEEPGVWRIVFDKGNAVCEESKP